MQAQREQKSTDSDPGATSGLEGGGHIRCGGGATSGLRVGATSGLGGRDPHPAWGRDHIRPGAETASRKQRVGGPRIGGRAAQLRT